MHPAWRQRTPCSHSLTVLEGRGNKALRLGAALICDPPVVVGDVVGFAWRIQHGGSDRKGLIDMPPAALTPRDACPPEKGIKKLG